MLSRIVYKEFKNLNYTKKLNLKNNDQIKQKILERLDVIESSISLTKDIEQSIDVIIKCLKKGNKIVLFGNGGSAADAQHIAAELIGKFNLKRKSLPAIALTSNSSTITALSNDYSSDVIFSRQCESLVNEGDTVIGISTSGNSLNVYNGLKISKKQGAKTIAMLGNNGGKISEVADVSIIVNSKNT